MRRSRLSDQVISQITDRVQKLKEYKDLCDSSVIQDISITAQLLQSQAEHDPYTGVPPPEDQSLQSIDTSFSSSILSQQEFDPFAEQKLQLIKQTNHQMQEKLKDTIKEFRQANRSYLSLQETPSITPSPLNELQTQLYKLNIKVLQSETEILHRENQKLFLQQQIEQLMRENSQGNSNCKCLMF